MGASSIVTRNQVDKDPSRSSGQEHVSRVDVNLILYRSCLRWIIIDEQFTWEIQQTVWEGEEGEREKTHKMRAFIVIQWQQNKAEQNFRIGEQWGFEKEQ